MNVDLAIARLAQLASAADRGVDAFNQGLVDDSAGAFHKGAAKAYRHAIDVLIEVQRESSSAARLSEQKAS